MNGQGQPSAQEIITAYQTPQAQLQLQQGRQQQPTPVNTTPAVDPNSATSGMDAVIANMYTSPEQEEKMRKASVANQRILAIGDALRHIGNIVNTVNYAPAQKFNSPVQEEYDRYQKGKAVRDAANLKYMTYQQQRAAQDAKQRQWEAEQKAKADQWNATFRFNAAKAAADLAEKQRQYNETAAFNKDKQKATEERWKRQDADTAKHRRTMEGIAGMNARTNRERASAYINHLKGGGGSGGGTRAGHTYATKNGNVTLPADYLKDKINKRTILTQLERDGAIDQDWLDKYDSSQWDEKGQERMLDEAVSFWLMNYDQAETFMEKHFRGSRGGSATPGKQRIEGFGGGSGKTKIQGFGGN